LGYRYDAVVIGVHHFSRLPRNNFGISPAAFFLIEQLQQRYRTITMVFGNPYAMKILCDNRDLISCYEDDSITHHIASDLLAGRFTAKGKLPVTVCPTIPSGAGIVADRIMTELRPADLGFRVHKLAAIDSIVTDAIKKRAIPGAVVLVAK